MFARVYDIAELQGHYFLSIEYVDGEDLAARLGRIGDRLLQRPWRFPRS